MSYDSTNPFEVPFDNAEDVEVAGPVDVASATYNLNTNDHMSRSRNNIQDILDVFDDTAVNENDSHVGDNSIQASLNSSSQPNNLAGKHSPRQNNNNNNNNSNGVSGQISLNNCKPSNCVENITTAIGTNDNSNNNSNSHRGKTQISDNNSNSSSNDCLNTDMDHEDLRYGRHSFRKQKTESLIDLNGRHLHGVLTRDARACPSPRSARSSLSDVNSSGSSSPRLASRDTTTSRKRWEMHHQDHQHQTTHMDPIGYLTPLQRRERETKQLRAEVHALQHENHRKEAEVTSLRIEMEERLSAQHEEMQKKLSQLQQAIEDSQAKWREAVEANASLKEELHKMDALYTETKHQLQKKDEMFNQCYLDMYMKGQQAAAFEREEELAILANKKHPRITVRELAKKLSKTETELARWQTLRRDEAYTTTERPEGQADVTLSFLRDSFYHFICDPKDSLRHFKAMLEIFKYSDTQMLQVRKSVDESKGFHKLFKTD